MSNGIQTPASLSGIIYNVEIPFSGCQMAGIGVFLASVRFQT
nr:MAG TPA: hypothetical protein [Bacteriophage sp.]